MAVYAEMKNSGADWLKRIPSHWKINKFKFHLCFSQLRDPGNSEVLSLYREHGVVPKDSRDDNHNATSEDTSSYRFVANGDFVVNKMKAWQGSVAVSDYDGIVSPAYYVYKFTDECFSKRYFHYLMRNKAYAEEFRRLSGGIRIGQWDLPKSALENMTVLIPPMEEQLSIAAYLDDQCGQIDALIEEAKASIEEYKAWKTSIITEVVTKGLDDSVPMRNSGIEWISEIPSQWQTGRFAFKNRIRARLGWKGLKAEEYVDVGYPFLSAFNIVSNQLTWTPLNYITQERYDESPDIKLSVGDILLVKDGAGIGKCARVDELPLGETTVNSSLAVITPHQGLDYRYEHYYLQSGVFQNIISRLKNGMGVPHLTQEAMGEISIPIPPITEQIEIVQYLDAECKKINEIIQEKQSLIDDLDSYKKSLIYEAVTGKRKVV